jgi:hypothetical protein
MGERQRRSFMLVERKRAHNQNLTRRPPTNVKNVLHCLITRRTVLSAALLRDANTNIIDT